MPFFLKIWFHSHPRLSRIYKVFYQDFSQTLYLSDSNSPMLELQICATMPGLRLHLLQVCPKVLRHFTLEVIMSTNYHSHQQWTQVLFSPFWLSLVILWIFCVAILGIGSTYYLIVFSYAFHWWFYFHLCFINYACIVFFKKTDGPSAYILIYNIHFNWSLSSFMRQNALVYESLSQYLKVYCKSTEKKGA